MEKEGDRPFKKLIECMLSQSRGVLDHDDS